MVVSVSSLLTPKSHNFASLSSEFSLSSTSTFLLYCQRKSKCTFKSRWITLSGKLCIYCRALRIWIEQFEISVSEKGFLFEAWINLITSNKERGIYSINRCKESGLISCPPSSINAFLGFTDIGNYIWMLQLLKKFHFFQYFLFCRRTQRIWKCKFFYCNRISSHVASPHWTKSLVKSLVKTNSLTPFPSCSIFSTGANFISTLDKNRFVNFPSLELFHCNFVDVCSGSRLIYDFPNSLLSSYRDPQWWIKSIT